MGAKEYSNKLSVAAKNGLCCKTHRKITFFIDTLKLLRLERILWF